MNFRKLLTYLTVSTAAVIPFAGAQNPTILQGSYISNVFGNSNFVKNPNAQTNVANVTNATRSTTTPLVATSEFTLALDAGANATWTLRAFDAGMKGQNCEARFSYRGFATATTTAEIVQNSLVVAHLTLTPSTDPRIASINFPCGDLVNATTFRIAQTTAAMTGTNEIGGIYVGLATNLGQLNTVGVWQSYTPTVTPGAGTLTSTGIDFAQYRRVGENIQIRILYRATQSTANAFGWTISLPTGINLVTDTVTTPLSDRRTTITITSGGAQAVGSVKIVNATSFEVTQVLGGGLFSTGTAYAINLDVTQQVQGWGADPVVTPERQNTFAGVKYVNSTQQIRKGQAASANYFEFNNATWNQPTLLIGKAQVTTTGSGNDLGFSVPNLPVGQYKVSARGAFIADTDGATTVGQTTYCSYKIRETILGADIALQVHRDAVATTTPVSTRDFPNMFFGVFNNTSVGTRNFRIEAAKIVDGVTGNNAACQAYSNTGVLNTEIVLLLEPLDQPSNSALYVQGPVLGANTGAAIPASYVGETKTVSPTTNVSATTFTTTDLTATITLEPGIWLLNANFGGYGQSSGGNANFDGHITTSANTLISAVTLNWTGGALTGLNNTATAVYTVTSSTAIKLRLVTGSQGATGIGATILANNTRLIATRLN